MKNKKYLLPILIGLPLLGWILQRHSERRDWERFQPAGKRIDIGGHRLYIHSMGEKKPGQPTIVLESGHGDWSMSWRKVQPAVARFARVVSYDRAGFGWSDPGPLPRTPDQLVTELHTLLQKAGETDPYIFVGHSMGGALSRLFYRRYPDQLLGTVWIDSAHEDLGSYLAFWKLAYPAFLAAVGLGAALARIGLIRLLGSRLLLPAYSLLDHSAGEGPKEEAVLATQLSTMKYFDALFTETAGMMQSKNWPEGVPHLQDLPVISVEAQYSAGRAWYYPSREWDQFISGWNSMHDDISQLSTRVTRVPAASGHVVMIEQPQIVIDAIYKMYRIVTQNQSK